MCGESKLVAAAGNHGRLFLWCDVAGPLGDLMRQRSVDLQAKLFRSVIDRYVCTLIHMIDGLADEGNENSYSSLSIVPSWQAWG